MRRRDFLGTMAATALTGFTVGRARAAATKLDVFSSSDANIVDFWNAEILPGFSTANPDLTAAITSGDGAAMATLAERAFAAMKTRTDPQVDLLEAVDPYHPDGSIKAGLWTDFSKAGYPDYAKLNPATLETPFKLPYRGSQVVLFYDGDKVQTVPRTFPELVAWIKQNPGSFAYARPDKGDSGACFIERALQEVTGQKPELFKPDNYTAPYADPMFAKVFALLRDLAPSLYEKGGYSAGNTPSIQLLANGAVSMTVAWSDMALTAIREGVVPPSIKVAQLQDLPFTGGYSGVILPTSSAHAEAARKLAGYLITPEVQAKIVTKLGGLPSLQQSALDPSVTKVLADVKAASIPVFPSNWEPALFAGWYRSVAPGVSDQ